MVAQRLHTRLAWCRRSGARHRQPRRGHLGGVRRGVQPLDGDLEKDEEVVDVLYEAVRPSVIAELDGGGYQTIRFTVRPKSVRCVVRPPLGLQEVAIHPMPLLV